MILEEMIKELRLNSNKRYVSDKGTNDELHAFIEDGCIKFEYAIGEKSNGKINLDRKWMELKQPVSFMEAAKSGRLFTVEHNELDNCNVSTPMSLSDFIEILYENFFSEDIREILTEGKFYIENEEDKQCLID